MNRLKLLAILEARSITGPTRNLLEFITFGRTLNVEVTVASFLRDEDTNVFTQKLDALCISRTSIYEAGPYDLSIVQRLKRLASDVDPDIIQTHAAKSHFLTRLSGVPRSIPWVAFHHGYTATAWRTMLYNELDRWSLKGATQVVTVSDALIGQLEAKGIESNRIKVIPNAVHIDYGSEKADSAQVQKLRSSLGIPQDRKIILAVGRLSKEKDQVSVVKAMKKLQNCSDPYLVVVGEGPERSSISNRAKLLGLADRVILVGHQDDLKPFYSLADVVVISSRSEGSPNVLLEALASGVPLVATAVGGIPEMVSDGVHALLVEHGNTRLMAESIQKVLSTSDLAQSLVEHGKTLIQTRFSPEERARRLLEVYRSLLH